MNRRILVPLALLTLCVPASAVADLVGLRSGSILRGTIANRAELLRSPSLVTIIEFRPETPGVDAASVRTLSFARGELDFVVIEEGWSDTTIPFSAIGDLAARNASGRPLWFALTASASDYALADLNALGTGLNSQLPTLFSLQPIGAGLGGGMELGLDLSGGLEAGLAWDRIRAASGTDAESDVFLSVSAFLLRTFASYGVVRSDRGSLRIGASLGAVVPSVTLRYANPTLAEYRDRVVGVAPAGELFGGGELQWNRWLGVSLDAGYRRAISKDVPVGTLDLRDLDYSGGFVRAGLRISLAN